MNISYFYVITFIFIRKDKLWEDPENILQMKNNMSVIEENLSVITNDTNSKLEKNECINIGTCWSKMCPKCNSRIIYKNKKCLIRSIRKNQFCKSCGLTGRTMPLLTEEHKDKIKNHHLLTGVGKWMIGRKLSTETKLKISRSNINRIRSDEAKHNYSLSKLGDKNPMKRLDVRIKNSITRKNNPRIITQETRQKIALKARENIIKQLEKMGDYKGAIFNPLACDYLDKLSEQYNWELRHAKNGGEVQLFGYFLDGYDKKKNIVVEYDEKHHYDVYGKLKEKDVVRMNYIINKLQCKFFRYNEKTQELKMYVSI